MNKKYMFLFLPLYIVAQSEVNFKIDKLDANNYQIIIEFPKELTFEKITITPNSIKEKRKDALITRILPSNLNSYIRNNIINVIIEPSSKINLTLDLYYLTTFNKAYRELYNAVREFSKDLARKPEVSRFNTFKRFIGLEESTDVFESEILPDLAPKAWFFTRAYQSHPKITKKTAVSAAAIIGGYAALKKAHQTGIAPTTPTPPIESTAK